MARRIKQTNPELEELRLKALNSATNGSINQDFQDVIRATNRIHAAFLFHSPKTLQPLLLALGETKGDNIGAGWQAFGDKLGLDVTILMNINNNTFNHEDPVYNTLLHYVQYEDATIGKIVEALREMGRLDVIMRTKDALIQLSDAILNHEQELIRTSLPSSNYGSMESNSDSSSSDSHIPSDILIKPSIIPDAPFIFRNVPSTPLFSTFLLQKVTDSRTNVVCSSTFSEALGNENLIQASPIETSPVAHCSRISPTESAKYSYAKKVMLTFAADGAETAEEVARILRQQRGMDRIGVLILGEQLRHLQADPNLFICGAFQLVDYVIPILTEGYLQSVLRKSTDLASSDCVDANYVAFIYRVMSQDYTRRGCLNEKVRCIVPDDQISNILNHLMMAGPLFAAWEKSSRTHLLAERILASQV